MHKEGDPCEEVQARRQDQTRSEEELTTTTKHIIASIHQYVWCMSLSSPNRGCLHFADDTEHNNEPAAPGPEQQGGVPQPMTWMLTLLIFTASLQPNRYKLKTLCSHVSTIG